MHKLLIKATIEILEESFTRNLPADIQLSYFFKKNRHLGSHDRSDIADPVSYTHLTLPTIYSV